MEMIKTLRTVRDWKSLHHWANDYKLPVVQRGKHYALIVEGQSVFISKTGCNANRGLLNARAQIMRVLKDGNATAGNATARQCH